MNWDLTRQKNAGEQESNGVFVVAEIGKNFIQSKEEKEPAEYLRNAKELVARAQEAGADAVKFQTHVVEDEQMDIPVAAPHFSGAERYEWLTRNEQATPMEFWKAIKQYCEELGILFFSTPMSRGAAMKLGKIKVPLWKVGSADILDFVLLDFLAETQKPILLSSGMSTLEEVDRSVEFLRARECDIALLHCVSQYPCPPKDLNLQTIDFFRKRYGIPVGFSDHSLGAESALAAISLGATIVEKHFSMGRDLWGPDHKVSMTPPEFQAMVRRIRSGEKVQLENYGVQGKILQQEEEAFRPIFRKALVAACAIPKGTVLEKEMLYAMRPQGYIGGIPSEEYERILGRTTVRDIKRYQPITQAVLEQ